LAFFLAIKTSGNRAARNNRRGNPLEFDLAIGNGLRTQCSRVILSAVIDYACVIKKSFAKHSGTFKMTVFRADCGQREVNRV
jgi:hypothetical protein